MSIDRLLINIDLLLTIVTYVMAAVVVGFLSTFAARRIPRIMDAEWAAEQAGEESGGDHATGFFDRPAQCSECNAELMFARSIPFFGRLLGGKCHACGKSIFAMNWLADIVLVSVAVAIGIKYGPSVEGAFFLLFAGALVTLALIDFETMLLPDRITLPLLWGGLLFNLYTGHVDLRSSVLGAVVGYLLLWCVYHVFKWVSGKEGLGYGDFKLLAAIGAVFGWQVIPGVVAASALVGGVVGVALAMLRDESRPYPFGPYLAGGGIVAIFAAPQLAGFYSL